MNNFEYCMNEKKIDCVEDGYAKIINRPYTFGHLLEFDNSADGYPSGYIALNFCPMCGRKLNLGYEPY